MIGPVIELETRRSPAALAPLPAPASPGALARALRAAGVPGVALLESGLALGELGRWSFLAARPVALAAAEPGRPLEVAFGPPEAVAAAAAHPADPLAAAEAVLAALRPVAREAAPAPFAGGGVLTLAYDLGRRYERWPARARADARPPDLHLAVYRRVLAIDHGEGLAYLLGAEDGPGLEPGELEAALRVAEREATGAGAVRDEAPHHPSLDRAAHRRAVAAARRLIRRGDLFEVNVTRRHAVEGVDPERLYAVMRRLTPAPYMADLELGRGRRLLSASPERFLRLAPDGAVSAWPIKGTRPRGATPEEDAQLAEELLASEKEAAELAMIVDLMRNDLGRVARPGSVRVADARRLQSWPAVHHTVGVVEAQLEAGRGWADLLRATFPPGSVTGAPKLRAIEVIEELEPVRRGLYCGAFGWVGWDGALDLAVAIRIAACEAGRALIHAGGAVLLDSDPAAEEREAALKARALLRAAAEARG